MAYRLRQIVLAVHPGTPSFSISSRWQDSASGDPETLISRGAKGDLEVKVIRQVSLSVDFASSI